MVTSQQAFELLRESILRLADLPDDLIEKLFALCQLVHYNKGQPFVMAGDVPEYVGLNLNGIFRLYYIDDDGKDLTKGFSTPGKFVISYSALAQHRPSYFFIEAIIETDLLRFNYQEWMHIVNGDLRWYPFLFKLLESVYIMKEMREKAFLMNNATSRYLAFREEYPGLEDSIKLYHVASFLGITPEALSRIRKKLRLT